MPKSWIRPCLVGLNTVVRYSILNLQHPVFSKLCVNVYACLRVVPVVNQEMERRFLQFFKKSRIVLQYLDSTVLPLEGQNIPNTFVWFVSREIVALVSGLALFTWTLLHMILS
jgi:hypothetical protein